MSGAPLDAAYDRALFTSGSESLDRYFREQVTQEIRRLFLPLATALASRKTNDKAG